MLTDFIGDAEIAALQSDAYNVYKYLGSELTEVEHVCCMARGAGFVDAFKFTVAHDLRIGIIGFQCAEQGDEGCTLGRSSGVGFMAFFVEVSLVADADGVGIVMTGMHADLILVAGLEQATILFDVVVIADAFAMETGVVT